MKLENEENRSKIETKNVVQPGFGCPALFPCFGLRVSARVSLHTILFPVAYIFRNVLRCVFQLDLFSLPPFVHRVHRKPRLRGFTIHHIMVSTVIDRRQTILKSPTYCTFIYATGSRHAMVRISFYYISTFHLVFLPCIKGGSIPPLSSFFHICTTRTTKSRFAPPLFFLASSLTCVRFVSLCAMKVGIINCCNVLIYTTGASIVIFFHYKLFALVHSLYYYSSPIIVSYYFRHSLVP